MAFMGIVWLMIENDANITEYSRKDTNTTITIETNQKVVDTQDIEVEIPSNNPAYIKRQKRMAKNAQKNK